MKAGSGHSHTFHRQGRADKCIDAIFVSSEWRVVAFDLLDRKGGGVWPSDHFGLRAELGLPGRTETPSRAALGLIGVALLTLRKKRS